MSFPVAAPETSLAGGSSKSSSEALTEQPSLIASGTSGRNQLDNKTFTRRIIVNTTATARELRHGKSVAISNAAKIFKPDFAMDAMDSAGQEQLSKLDTSKGIISKVEVMSAYSNAKTPVTLGMRLFQRPDSSAPASHQDLRITNSCGWLYTMQKNELGETASSGRPGITNIFALQPFERYRGEGHVVYEPTNVINNRLVEQYGSFSWESLWKGVISFPGEGFYYVSKSHILCQLIESNWEILGLDIKSELPREGKYLKISCDVCDRVLKELFDNVISRIPFTKWSNLAAVFTSDQIDASDDVPKNLSVELRVSFVYPSLTE